MGEIWRDVPGHEWPLEVSSLGGVRIRSRIATGVRNGSLIHQTRPAKVLSPYIANNGYPTVAVMVGGRRRKFTVHRLVAQAFVDGYSPELTVNHINGDKADNRIRNLEWVSLA